MRNEEQKKKNRTEWEGEWSRLKTETVAKNAKSKERSIGGVNICTQCLTFIYGDELILWEKGFFGNLAESTVGQL